MIFSLSKLERILAEDKLTSHEKAQYLIFLQVMSALLFIPSYVVQPFFKDKPFLYFQIISLMSYFVAGTIIYIGLKKCFSINKSIDNRLFIERIIVLSVPITVRIVGISYCLLASFGYMFKYDTGNPYHYLILKFMHPFCASLYIILLLRSIYCVGKNIKSNGVGVHRDPSTERRIGTR